jgi:hypothetical protein
MTSPRWLLLAHQLPTRKSNARVKTWRRLQQIGAVPARNSVYVLPNIDECREDFEWLRTEIVSLGGEATVFAADALNADGAEAIVASFQQNRGAGYAALKRETKRLMSQLRGRRPAAQSRREHWTRVVRALRQRLSDLERIDFFSAPARQESTQALAELERLIATRPDHGTSTRLKTLTPSDFQKRRWVTRPRPGVDRIASAWLIRRFIDPQATFAFVDRAAQSDVAFDMYGGPFSHHGGLCTFEVLAASFALAEPAIRHIGEIVHDLDLKEARYARQEATTVGRMVEGLRQSHPDDQALLDHGMSLFEALARSFASAPAPAATARGSRVRQSGKATRRVR